MSVIPLSKTTKFIVDNRGKTVPTATNGIPLIATNCIDSNHLYPVYENLRYISKNTYDTWFRSHLQPNDIILTLKGSQNGAACLVPDPVDFVIAQDMVALRPDESVIEPLFLFAALRSEEVQNQIKSLDVSGVIPHFKKSDFDKLLLPYPDRISQKFIGDIYYCFCKKIDLLHRQNKTLEALAETLFRQWFVEEVEESWEMRTLDDVIELLYGKGLKEEVRTGTGFPVIGSSGVVGYHSEYLVEGPGIVIGRKGTLGKVIYLFENFFPIDTTYFVKSKLHSIGLFYEYFLLKTQDFKNMNSDSAVPGLNREIALSSEIKIAPNKKIREFNSQCSALFQKIKSNSNQINILIQLRDTLLPKLMSGEVRIEKVKENALPT